MRWPRNWFGLLVLVLLAGCGSRPAPLGPEDLRTVRTDLLARLDAVSPQPWRVAPTGQRALCDRGGRTYLPTATLPAGYPQRVWPRVRSAVLAVGRAHGFTVRVLDVERPIGEPGAHPLLEVDLRDATGAELDLEVTPSGSRLSLVTSCLLAQQRQPAG